MSNIIRLNETAPNDKWIIMSNQGNTGIVIPWLERFALLIDQMTAENLHVKSGFVRVRYRRNG